MGTTRDAFGDSGLELAFCLLIEGYDRIITTCADTAAVATAYAATDWTQVISGMAPPGEISTKMEIFTGLIDAPSISLVVAPDASDTFAKELHQTALLTGYEAVLTADLDATATTIAVDDTTGWPSSGTGYIGTEAFAYSGKTGTSFTGVTRGKWAPWRSYTSRAEGTQRFSRRHVLTNIRGVSHAPLVTSYPRSWSGRLMRLVAHRVTWSEGSRVLDVFSEAETIFSGFVEEITEGEAGYVAVECTDIRRAIADTMLLNEQYSGTIAEGLYFSAGDGTVAADKIEIIDSDDSDITLTTVSGAPADHTEMTEGYYRYDDLLSILTEWTMGEYDAGNISNRIVWQRDETNSGGTRTRIIGNGHTPGARERMTITILATVHLFDFLGFEESLSTYGIEGLEIQTAFSTTPSFNILGQATPLRSIGFSFVAAGDGSDSVRLAMQKLKLEDISGSWVTVPFQNRLPIGYNASADIGLIRIGDTVVYGTYDSATETFSNIGFPGSVASAHLGITEDRSYERLTEFGRTSIDDQAAAPVTQIVVVQDSMSRLLSQMFASTGVEDYNWPGFDIWDAQLGVGLPYELLVGDETTRSFIWELASLESLTESTDITIVLDKPTSFKDVLQPELQLRMANLVTDGGYLSLATPTLPGPTPQHTLTTSNKAGDPDTADANRTRARRTSRLIRDKITVQFNRTMAGSYRSERTVVSGSAITDRGGIANPVTIRARNTVGAEVSTAAAVESQVTEIASYALGMFRKEVTEVSRSIDRSLFAIQPGQTVSLTDDSVRNPRTGLRGVTAYPCFVEAVSKDWARMIGEVSLIMFGLDDPDRFGQLSPSAELSAYDTGTGVATVREHRYSLPASANDVTHFAAGDVVRFIEISPSDPSSPSTWIDTIDSISGNNVTTVGNVGSGTYNSALTYVMVSDDYSNAAAAQQSDAYLAASGDRLVQDAAKGFLWSRERLVSSLTYSTNLGALDLDGPSQQYLRINDEDWTGLDDLTEFSVEFDVRFESLSAIGATYLVGIVGTTPANSSWAVQWFHSAAELRLTVYEGLGNASLGYSWTPKLCRWYRIGASFNAGAADLYIDSVNVATSAGIGVSSAREAGTAAQFQVGSVVNSTIEHDGQIDNLAFWNRELAAQEFIDHRYREMTGTEDGLVSFWDFNNDFQDRGPGANHLTGVNGASIGTTVPWALANDVHRYPSTLSDTEGEPLSAFVLANSILTANNLISYKTAPQMSQMVGGVTSSAYEYRYTSADADVWRFVTMFHMPLGSMRGAASDFAIRIAVAPMFYRVSGSGTVSLRVTFTRNKPVGTTWDDVTFQTPFEQLEFSTSSTSPTTPCWQDAVPPLYQRDGRVLVVVELKAAVSAVAAYCGMPTCYRTPMSPG